MPTVSQNQQQENAIRDALEPDRRLTAGERPVAHESTTITEEIAAHKDYLIAEGRSEKTIGKYPMVLSIVVPIAQSLGRASILDVSFALIDKKRVQRAKTCASSRICDHPAISQVCCHSPHGNTGSTSGFAPQKVHADSAALL